MGSLEDLRMGCFPPFFNEEAFPDTGGYVSGRLCANITGAICCLPCPLTDWVYPDNFKTATQSADWINVAGMVGCAFLLLSWVALPVERTHRHYLSICLTVAVVFMNLGFIIPLAGKPEECFNEITPHGQDSSSICAASGAFLLLGGWGGVLWVFLRALSLHLQICWQMVVGRNYMWFSQALGWGIPVVGLVLLLVFSGVSFRFGQTCHINHENSLADFWVPLLIFAGLTVVIQFATFGYCIKVYLASLADNAQSSEHSGGGPSYTNSIRTMTPRQAYRRVRRVVQLQWRGIVIVLIIIADVIFFAIIFVFLDNTVEDIKTNPDKARPWIICLVQNGGDKNACLDMADELVVSLPTVTAVLILLAMNGFWLLLILGRWSMVTGWAEWFAALGGRRHTEFVSVDARLDLKNDPRSYEIAKSPVSPGRKTPDYFSQTAPYRPHQRSFSSPRAPHNVHFEMMDASPHHHHHHPSYPEQPPAAARASPATSPSLQQQQQQQQPGYPVYNNMNPLKMNKIPDSEEARYSHPTFNPDEVQQYNQSNYSPAKGPGHVFI
ncbi:putative frizzled smoothened-like sans CRD protein B [Rosellinia necatrix]|uniref:Putative frizzled smoothened-like sans CRD protein B n=1 Tax=Rosellinia necatrix TaxID=77044 RepID=A0A1W2TD65_ROSNE|nr:putative frizzled smoothened-like sans CRD protein B [Rosellinia necatrix]